MVSFELSTHTTTILCLSGKIWQKMIISRCCRCIRISRNDIAHQNIDSSCYIFILFDIDLSRSSTMFVTIHDPCSTLLYHSVFVAVSVRLLNPIITYTYNYYYLKYYYFVFVFLQLFI